MNQRLIINIVITCSYLTKLQTICVQNTNTSGSHKRINPDKFLDINIILPELAEQKRIGKLLSDIDHKIELNRAINQNLPISDRSSKAVGAHHAA